MYLIYIHITSVYVYYLFIIYTHKETKTWNRKRKKKEKFLCIPSLFFTFTSAPDVKRCFKTSKCPLKAA